MALTRSNAKIMFSTHSIARHTTPYHAIPRHTTPYHTKLSFALHHCVEAEGTVTRLWRGGRNCDEIVEKLTRLFLETLGWARLFIATLHFAPFFFFFFFFFFESGKFPTHLLSLSYVEEVFAFSFCIISIVLPLLHKCKLNHFHHVYTTAMGILCKGLFTNVCRLIFKLIIASFWPLRGRRILRRFPATSLQLMINIRFQLGKIQGLNKVAAVHII
ncbi:hypothetical protein POVWA2_049030 [Plasmodium ovale wallikeri]|uniref:Uncharacterized protein n=1 Tax=Plasmodium ovale wallikeri TaxID=864142 RepID=A0A1A8ZMH2_PLAOA|nr:hypothetical protein POVWA2_049030 [Plasmodium ovale wallikeri]